MRLWVWNRHRGQLLPWVAVLIAAVLVPFSLLAIEFLYRQRYTEVVREAMKATAHIIVTTPDYAELSAGTAVRFDPDVLRTIDTLIVANLGDAVSTTARQQLAESLMVMMRPIRWQPRECRNPQRLSLPLLGRPDPERPDPDGTCTVLMNDHPRNIDLEQMTNLVQLIEKDLSFWTGELGTTAGKRDGVGTTVCIGGYVTFEGPLAHLLPRRQPVVGCATVVSF
jgi:hypothetical protein